MLPEIRRDEYRYPVPKFDIKIQDIEDFEDELKGFHDQFHDCFLRSESRSNFLKYMAGQFSDLERKSIEPIALTHEESNVRALQRFVSDAPWDDKKMGLKYRTLVNDDLGDPNGALIFDESGFAKKGDNSVGVARQYCGTLGKVDNCQVGIFAGYVSERGYVLVDKRLYLPEIWFTDDYRERREKCNLPEDDFYKTKPELAVEMLDSLREENVLPFKYVLADSIYGVSPEFINAVDALGDTTYLVQVPKSTRVWVKQPMTITRTYQWGGKTREKTEIIDTNSHPTRLDELARNINNYFWYKRKVSEGTKGPIVYEFTRRRVILSGEGLSCKTVWLLIRRTVGEKSEYSYYLSNAQRAVRLRTLIWLSGLRWAIEQCFEETKTELGMDHYEVRKYMGWHHHILTCMMAHFFLWHLKIRMGKKSTIHYTVAV